MRARRVTCLRSPSTVPPPTRRRSRASGSGTWPACRRHLDASASASASGPRSPASVRTRPGASSTETGVVSVPTFGAGVEPTGVIATRAHGNASMPTVTGPVGVGVSGAAAVEDEPVAAAAFGRGRVRRVGRRRGAWFAVATAPASWSWPRSVVAVEDVPGAGRSEEEVAAPPRLPAPARRGRRRRSGSRPRPAWDVGNGCLGNGRPVLSLVLLGRLQQQVRRVRERDRCRGERGRHELPCASRAAAGLAA